MKTFKATNDKENIYNYIFNSTYFLTFLFSLGYTINLLHTNINSYTSSQVCSFSFLLITLIVLGVLSISTIVLRPRFYAIDNGCILIKKIVDSTVIPFNEIKNISRISVDELGLLTKSWAMRGDENLGYYTSKKYGKILFYTTQKKNYILIETAKRKYIISPDNDVEFEEDLKKMLGLM